MARTVGKNAFWTLLTGLAGAAISIGTGIITARMLGPHDKGLFALAVALPHTVVTLVKFGLAPASIYAIRRERRDPSVVASQVMLLAIIGGTGALAAMYAFKWQAFHYLMKGAPLVAFLFSMFLVPFLLIESYFFAVLQALDDFSLFNRRRLLGNVVTFIGMFIALIVFHGGLAGALAVPAGATILFDLWLVLTVHSMCRLRFLWDGRLVKRLLSFGVKSHVQQIATHLHVRVDVYIVAALLNPSEVAFYTIATRLAELLLFVPEALGLVVYPKQTSSALNELHELTATSCRHIVFSTVSAGIVLALIGPRLIVAWYGASYAPAGPPIYYLVPAAVMMSLFFMLSRNFTSQNRQGVNVVASTIALSGNLLANFLLIPRMGIAGAGLASLITYSVATTVLARVYLRDSRKSLRDLIVIRIDDFGRYRQVFWEILGRKSRPVAEAAVVSSSSVGGAPSVR
jgi:O-antigen/teichoic acid export membrane protein